MRLRIGVGRADISPTWPVQLAGFGSRHGVLVGKVAHAIFARVAILTDAETSIGIVSGELLNWSTESDERFRSAVSTATGVPPQNLAFVATHTHSAPQVSHRQAPRLGVVDDRYLDFLEERLVTAARDAVANLNPVTITRVRGRWSLAKQRRAELDLAVSSDPIRIDDELTVVTFDDATNGRPRAMFLHYSCHPVVSAENAVSGDFFGYAATALEAATGAVTLPLQGCCGDINPHSDAPHSGLDRARQIGTDMAATAAHLLRSPRTAVTPPSSLQSHWHEATLPFAAVPSVNELRAVAAAPGLDGQWASALIRTPELIREHTTCRLQLLHLGDNLQLLLMDGEVTTEYGLYIKELTHHRTIPVAYSNGMIGYIPTARQIHAGGYEVDESARCYLLPGRFSPAIERHMKDGIDTLLTATTM